MYKNRKNFIHNGNHILFVTHINLQPSLKNLQKYLKRIQQYLFNILTASFELSLKNFWKHPQGNVSLQDGKVKLLLV